jgi:hypothetical protein
MWPPPSRSGPLRPLIAPAARSCQGGSATTFPASRGGASRLRPICARRSRGAASATCTSAPRSGAACRSCAAVIGPDEGVETTDGRNWGAGRVAAERASGAI